MTEFNNSNQNVLIIGSTNGIGLELTKLFDKNKYNVVTSGRDQSKVAKYKFPFFKVNLTNFKSIFIFCNQIKEYYRTNGDHIDILILNAGIFSNEPVFQKNGLEITFMVNFFAHVMITLELMNIIKGKIIMISSPASMDKSMCADMIQYTHNQYSFSKSYGTSKLLLNVWANIINKKYGIPSVALSPGAYIDTGMLNSDMNSLYGFIRKTYHYFTIKSTPTQSAELVYRYIKKINRRWYGCYIQPNHNDNGETYEIIQTDQYVSIPELNDIHTWIQAYSQIVKNNNNYIFPTCFVDQYDDSYSMYIYLCLCLCVLLFIILRYI